MISAFTDQPRRMSEVFERFDVQNKLSSVFCVEKMSHLRNFLCVPTHLTILSFLNRHNTTYGFLCFKIAIADKYSFPDG